MLYTKNDQTDLWSVQNDPLGVIGDTDMNMEQSDFDVNFWCF